MNDPAKITSASPYLADLSQRINDLIDATRPARNLEGRGPLKVTASDANVVFELLGYQEINVTLCLSGENVSGRILFKRD